MMRERKWISGAHARTGCDEAATLNIKVHDRYGIRLCSDYIVATSNPTGIASTAKVMMMLLRVGL